MKMKSLFLFPLVLLGLAGCTSAPTKFEQKFYDIETNYVPQLVIHTNTISVTNFVTREVRQTNVVNDITQITITPVKEQYVSTQYALTYQTNFDVTYTYHANTNAALVGQVGGAIGAPFGFGGLVSTGIAGLFAIWGAIRSRKKGQVAAGLAQGIEVASEVLKTTPQGNELDDKLKTWLQTHQVQTNTAQEVLKLLETTVDNQDAKEVAGKIIQFTDARK